MIGFCCKILGTIVLLVAVIIGLFLSGFVAERTSFFALLDEVQVGRGMVFKGLFPATHKNAPWGYTFEELNNTDLTGQLIVITGGNSGLGYWTALLLARRNADVVITCRMKTKCEQAVKNILEATGHTVACFVCDLSSFSSILSFSKEFKEKYTRLSSLILNAGVGAIDFSLTEDGIESQIGINYFGHFLLAKELLPLLEVEAREKGVATIVSVSSCVHYDSYPGGILSSIEQMNDPKLYDKFLAYGQSKLAIVAFARELSERVKAKNILVNSVHPGSVTTPMQRGLKTSITPFLGSFITQILMDFMESLSWKAEVAALTEIYAATGNELKQKKITGKYFHPIARETPPDPYVEEDGFRKHLWQLTEDFISSKIKT